MTPSTVLLEMALSRSQVGISGSNRLSAAALGQLDILLTAAVCMPAGASPGDDAWPTGSRPGVAVLLALPSSWHLQCAWPTGYRPGRWGRRGQLDLTLVTAYPLTTTGWLRSWIAVVFALAEIVLGKRFSSPAGRLPDLLETSFNHPPSGLLWPAGLDGGPETGHETRRPATQRMRTRSQPGRTGNKHRGEAETVRANRGG